jgi:membrane associated rhomboid family serine protease
MGFSENQARYKSEGLVQEQTYIEPKEPIYWGTMLLGFFMILGYMIQIILDEEGMSHAIFKISNKTLVLGAAGMYFDRLGEEQYWRLFTYTMLHGGIFHLFFNLMTLQQIAPLIEETFGFSRLMFAWVIAGIGAILLPEQANYGSMVVIGASGSIFGFIGIAMAYGHLIKTDHGRYVRNKMIEWTVICTIFGLGMGGVAHGAHFGGLITGWALAILLPPPNSSLKKSISIPLSLLAFAFIFYALYSALQFYEKTL